MSEVLLEGRRSGCLVEGAKFSWFLLPRRALGTSKATKLARKYHVVHIEVLSNQALPVCDIWQPLDPCLESQVCPPTPEIGHFYSVLWIPKENRKLAQLFHVMNKETVNYLGGPWVAWVQLHLS